jgi:hypothetical protein
MTYFVANRCHTPLPIGPRRDVISSKGILSPSWCGFTATSPVGWLSSDSAVILERLIDERLPQVELSELLVEVDGWRAYCRSRDSR